MKVFYDIPSLKQYINTQRIKGQTIGLVPTMGALHEGHMSLVNHSKNHDDLTICSIYVNPIQFNNQDDLSKYPRTLKADLDLLSVNNCDAVFVPSNDEIYKHDPILTLSFGVLENEMEGKFRPGHFSGVGLIVSKFFNIVKPDSAYFGQKDLQQFLIIKQLVRDLSYDIDLVCVPTVREANGLAMSSRNQRLSLKEREDAALIYTTLRMAEKLLVSGVEIRNVREKVHHAMNGIVQLEYFEVVDVDNMNIMKEVATSENIAICIAAYIGEVRLIDNLIFNLGA